jgi:hypothetical protein
MAPCIRCQKNLSVYNVTAPICMDSITAPLCPSCFQSGIDAGEIVWLGDKPYGICSDCETAATA